MRTYYAIVLAFLLIALPTFAVQVSVKTNDYVYSANESIYASVLVSENSSALSNQSVSISVKDSSGTDVKSSSGTTNSSGEMNYTFSLANTGNYTIVATSSSVSVTHFIKILSYSTMQISLNKVSYTPSSTVVMTANVIDINGNGVASVIIAPTVRYKNGSTISTITSCTTDSVGKCSTSFTAPAAEGEYMMEINNFETVVPLLVGGFSAAMKVSPGVAGKGDNITIRVTVKNANGNGMTASTKQLVIIPPNNSQITIASMSQATDSSGLAVTGVYEDTFSSQAEGLYSVIATVTPQGSNLSKELRGAFEIRAYVIEIGPWDGQLAYYPGSVVLLAVKLKNASTGDNIAGKATTITSGTKVRDQSDVDTGISPIVTDQVSTDGKYKMTFTMPASSPSGTYKVIINVNDSFGSASGAGYFSIQRAKSAIVSFDNFPEATPVRDFIAGKKIVLRFSAQNLSGAVPVTGVSSYSISNKNGGDATSLFGTNATYTSGNYTYMNLTAPKNGGDYFVRAKIDTSVGSAAADGKIEVSALDVSVRPASVGGGGGSPGTGGPGPGYFWFFRPNDTAQLSVTVTSASEKQGNEGFMSKGSFGGGPAAVSGGLFGVGGGSAIQGAQVTLTKLMNLNTEEDWTSSATITNCVTDTTGACTVSMTSNVNGQNWTGGFYIAFFNISTSDNKTDDAEGFFDVRRFFMDVRVTANTSTTASTFGFSSFNNWNVGPNTGINVSVAVREPGTWQSVSQQGTLDVLGAYYGGNAGEFIFPPKLITGTAARLNISGSNSTVISAPSTGWKSGFYIIKVRVNLSGQLDTGEGFFMSKIFEGFGRPINPTTKMDDFTIGTTENVTLQVDVFNVVNYRPAANLTVSLSKILSFQSFPPAELAYTETVSQGTTDSSGQVVMTLPVPSGGWATGNYLAVMDVTNGTSTDQVQGFFMVKNFFAEISTSSWTYGTSDQINFTATISSDPSWMRNRFGGGCPPEDTTCSGGGSGGSGGSGGGSGPSVVFKEDIVTFGAGYDIDGDTWPDINITARGANTFEANLSATNLTVLGVKRNASIAFMGCVNNSFSPCVVSEKTLKDFDSGGPFQTMKCQNPGFNPIRSNTGYRNTTNMTAEGAYNASHTAYFCINSTTGQFYKVGMRGPGSFGETNNNWSIEYIQDLGESGGFGGSTGVTSVQAGVTYYNSTLKSVKVARFDFSTGETVLREGTDYNVTSKDGTIKGTGNILIPGVGTFVVKPLSSGAAGGTWTSGDYFVEAKFNNSLGTESAQWGFRVETFTVSCYRPIWSDVQGGTNVTITCMITDPSTGRPYTGATEVNVESIMETMTGSMVSSSLWSDATSNAHRYNKTMNVTLYQNLPTGQYQATLKINQSSDVKRSYMWFEVRDFTPSTWTEKYNYGSSDDILINAQGTLAGSYVTLNASYTGATPQITIYKYDRSTWARSEVTGFTVKTTNSTVPVTRLIINISKSGGWDEGNYEVVLNLTKTTPAGVATGSAVTAHAWYDVRLFGVGSWVMSWSNHPKNNVSVRVSVRTPDYSGYYSGNVIVDINRLESNTNGTVMINGTHYSVTAVTANPATRGDIEINITPIGAGLKSGDYKAKFSVKDANGNTAFTDAWFSLRAFDLFAYAESMEVETGANATIIVMATSPSGPVQLTGLQITSVMACSSYCNAINTSALIYSFNHTTNRLNVNTTNLSQGGYAVNFVVNDTQNSTASAYAHFTVSPFSVSGKVLRPYEFLAGETYRWSYMINETMRVNVTGSPNVNVTNVTIGYWSCMYTCTRYEVDITLGSHLIGPSGRLELNITPPGANVTWFTGPHGWVYYDMKFSAVKSGTTQYFYGSIGVEFPSAWGRMTGISTITPTQNISSTIRMTIDYDGHKNLSNANVTFSRIYLSSTGQEVNTSATNFTATFNITNATGQAILNITPSGSFKWPTGQLWMEYLIKYGNASTTGGRGVTVSQNDVRIDAKLVHNFTNANSTNTYVNDNQRLGFVRGNGTTSAGRYSEMFNISVIATSPGSQTNADVTITLPLHNTNSSALAINHTNLTYGNVVMQSGVARQFNWTFNVTQKGNWSGTISIVPRDTALNTVSTTYGFESV